MLRGASAAVLRHATRGRPMALPVYTLGIACVRHSPLLHTSALALDKAQDKLEREEEDEERSVAGTAKYPASFILPTTVPYVSRLAKSEADHRRKLLGLLQEMNLPRFRHAFAYGSGVFSQSAMSKKPPGGAPPMIDMVIAVKRPVHWHALNMRNNPHHYPWWVRWGGHWMLRKVQDMGAGIWYVPYVQVGGEVGRRNSPDCQVRYYLGGQNV